MKFYINREQFVQRTKKELDGNNYLVAYDVPIAKTGIQQYTREELGDNEGNPQELLNVYRAREVFEDKELIESFDGIPIVFEHPENGRVDNENFKQFVVGTVSGVYYKDGSLYAKKLTIIDKDAIENILGKRTNELSIGFRGKVTKKSGNFEGQNYQYQEDVIHANHLALCENGKAGSFYAINSTKGKKKMAGFTTLSVAQEHERIKELKNSEVQQLNIGAVIERQVKQPMSSLKPHLINEEEEPKVKELKDEEDMDEMVNESEEEEKVEDEAEEGKKELEKKESKKKDLEDSVEEMEEADKKDRDIINALKKSNDKLRSIVNSKNKLIKSLELNKISLETTLDESKEMLRDLANRLKQKNLTNSMAGPDFAFDRKDDLLRNDFNQSLTSSFLYARK